MATGPLEPRKCSAKSKRSGEQCKRWAVQGLTVCPMHGGLTPVAQEKAAEVVQAATADGELRKLWVGLDNATAVTDPVASMARLAGALEQLLDEVGTKVENVKTIAAGENLSQVRGELVFLERTAALLARLLDSMARLGIAERQVQLEQERAQMVTAAFRAAVAAVASQLLTPADRDLMIRVFLRGIGVEVPDALEVPA